MRTITMLSALYIVTGTALTLQTYWLLMWAIWGAPTSVWQYAAFLGALGLAVVGVINIWRPHATVYAAVICELLIWSFYLPALIVTVTQALLPQSIGVMELRELLQYIVEYGLIVLVTTASIRRLLNTTLSKKA